MDEMRSGQTKTNSIYLRLCKDMTLFEVEENFGQYLLVLKEMCERLCCK